MNIWAALPVLIVLGPAWFGAGNVARRLKLPTITGNVVGGLLCGPSFLTVLAPEALDSLVPIEQGCLAIIALAAGSEVTLGDFNRNRRQVIAITLMISLLTYGFVTLAVIALAPYVPVLATMPEPHMRMLASLAGTLMIARSPATAVAVMRETEAKGPFCTLVMSVIVCKDVLLFVCFAINVEFARVLMSKEEGPSRRVPQLLAPFASLGASLLLGCLAGFLMASLLLWRTGPQQLPPARFARLGPLRSLGSGSIKTLLMAATAVGIFPAAEALGAEPLLSCVVAGVIITNRRGDGACHAQQEELMACLQPILPAVNMAFFGLAGASLRLAPLLATLWAACIIWVVRLAAIFLGAWLGAFLGGSSVDHRRRMWQAMITQAGVALGLAKTLAIRFPSWGPDFASILVAIILMNLLAGPPLFRGAVIASGEARAASRGEVLDGLSDRDGVAKDRPSASRLRQLGELPAIRVERAVPRSPSSMRDASPFADHTV